MHSARKGPAKKRSATQTNLYLNVAVFIAFLAAMDPEITGLSIHDWKWILKATRRYLIPNRLWPCQQAARQG